MTKKDLQALRWAVGQAETWRGSYIGNPDSSELAHFDKCIKEAKAALKACSLLLAEKVKV